MESFGLLFGLFCIPFIGALYCIVTDYLLRKIGVFAWYLVCFILWCSLLAIPSLLYELSLLQWLGAKVADARFRGFGLAHVWNAVFGPASLANIALFPYGRRDSTHDYYDDYYRRDRLLFAAALFAISAWIILVNVYNVSDVVNGIDGMGDMGG